MATEEKFPSHIWSIPGLPGGPTLSRHGWDVPSPPCRVGHRLNRGCQPLASYEEIRLEIQETLDFSPRETPTWKQLQGLLFFKQLVTKRALILCDWFLHTPMFPTSGWSSLLMDWLDSFNIFQVLFNRTKKKSHFLLEIQENKHFRSKLFALNSQYTIFSQIRGMRGAFLDGSDGKESACNAGDLCSIPWSGRSPGEGNGNPLQYSCLGNPTEEPGGLQSMGLQRVRQD